MRLKENFHLKKIKYYVFIIILIGLEMGQSHLVQHLHNWQLFVSRVGLSHALARMKWESRKAEVKLS